MTKRLLATTALALSLALPALAQTSTTDTGTTAQEQGAAPTTQGSGGSGTDTMTGTSTTTGGGASTDTGTAGTTGTSDSATTNTAATGDAIISRQGEDQVRADKVIGAKVTNAENENVGSVSDLLLDKNGQVVGMILSVGGFLGIGEKHVALSWDKIKLEDDGKKVVIDMTKDQIANAPKFVTREEVAETPANSTDATTPPLPATGSTQSGTSTSQ
jgi:sporulation protein YlmC with PRC-barrel domain